MLELLSPAGSPEAVRAAVQSGADAIYLGYGNFNARRNAVNFDEAALQEAVQYCHLRGVKVYLTLNTLLNDRELTQAAKLVDQVSQMGVDALLVQDLGVARMCRQVAPDLPLHASTQMTIHSLDGAKAAADLGMTRVVVSRELSRDQIAYLCDRSPVEIECFVHGALCMCYSGQCFFSSVIGGRSGNRGMCAQPCRLNYGWGQTADKPLLSLKDMSLAKHLQELEEMGVACAKIEGRMKRPEYVAVVTKVYLSQCPFTAVGGAAGLADLLFHLFPCQGDFSRGLRHRPFRLGHVAVFVLHGDLHRFPGGHQGVQLHRHHGVLLGVVALGGGE